MPDQTAGPRPSARPHAELDANDGGRRVLFRNWQRTIPRDHV